MIQALAEPPVTSSALAQITDRGALRLRQRLDAI
jgi:hypothetical protein